MRLPRFMLGILASVGFSSSTNGEQQMIDPKDILFSIPTIADDAPQTNPQSGNLTDADLLLHEDDWRQVGFFPKARLAEIQAKLTEFKAFEATHRVKSGWKKVYVRKIGPQALVNGDNAIKSLETIFGVKADKAPVVFVSSNIIGRIANGFSVRMGSGFDLYGTADSGGIMVLAASLNGGDQLLTEAFMKLNKSNDLILVDWRSQMIAVGVSANGQIEVWQP